MGAILWLAMVLVSSNACGQTSNDEIPYHITADNLRAWVDDGIRVWDLTGRVRVTHGDAEATSERGRYWEDMKKLSLSGNVVVIDGEMILRTEEAFYNQDTVDVWEGLELEEDGALITADRGRYLVGEKRAILVGGVEYRESPWWITADSLVYHREVGLLHAIGNVVLKDDNAEMEARGGVLIFNRETRLGHMETAPVLYLKSKGDEPPVEVRGVRIDFSADGETATAVGDVVIAQENMISRCDSAVFFNRDERAILLGSPVMEEGERHITGERMEIDFREGRVRRLLVAGDALAEWRHEDRTLQGERKSSMLSGDRIRMLFDDDELRTIVVVGDARSVFYPEESRKIDEVNTIDGDRITLTVEEEKFNRVFVEGDAAGVYSYVIDGTEAPEDSVVYENVRYQASEIEYLVPDHMILMEDEADVEFGSTRLHAGRIEYDSEAEWMLATEKPVLWERQDRMDGSRMTYNLGAEQGTIFGGKTKYDKGYYTGKRLRKMGENELNADWGMYTSCDHDEPHYSFRARRMKLYLKDKVVAKPVVLYIRDIPLIPLPFYVFPIKPGRHSGLLVPNLEPGINKEKGRFIKNLGYYWAINDYSDLAGWMDFYENGQWTGHLRGRYNVRYLLNGNAEGSYTAFPEMGGVKKRRWDLRARHNQNVTDQLSLIARADFVSDESYRVESNDIDQSYLDRINQELKSSLSLNQRWTDRSMALTMDRREFLNINETDTRDDLKVSQTVPKASFRVFRRRLSNPPRGQEDEARWYQTIYYDLSSQMSRKETVREYGRDVSQNLSGGFSLSSQKIPGAPSLRVSAKAVDVQNVEFSLDRSLDSTSGDWNIDAEKTKDEERWASSVTVSLGGSPKLMGWLNVRPSFRHEMTLFDRDKMGNRWARLNTWNSSLGLGTTLYGTFLPGWGKLEGVRHVLKPTASWTYRPEFDQYDRDDYDRIGGIGAPTLTGQSSMNLGLSNMFHLKLRDGEEVRKLDNVVQLSSNTSYDFRYKENNRDHPWGSLNSSLVIQPTRAFDLRYSTVHDLDERRLKSRSFTSSLKLTGRGFSIGTSPEQGRSIAGTSADEETRQHLLERDNGARGGAAPTEPWRLSLAYRFSKQSPTADPTQWLNADFQTDLTANWKIVYGNRYDLAEKEVAYQKFTLYRDLHCWEARVSGEYSNEQWTYYFKINIKAHPELHIERGARRIGGGGMGGGSYY
ncbi:MAG: hypothetical protein KAW17_08330 [Candidatus Eisenbacteria sp.]|nr:hypothetical protein [Candidatus Eisenbacteria bacterium]